MQTNKHSLTLGQLEQMVSDQNPHRFYAHAVVNQTLPPKPRNLTTHIATKIKRLRRPGEFKHELVVGPRRVGKSVLLRHLVQDLLQSELVPQDKIVYLSFEDPAFSGMTLNDVMAMLAKLTQASLDNPCWLFADEVTHIDYWDIGLKMAYDHPLRFPINIVATSSSAWHLNQMTDSGPGRWHINHMFPCQLHEYCQLLDIPVEAADFEGETLRENLLAIPAGTTTPLPNQNALRLFGIYGGYPVSVPADWDLEDPNVTQDHRVEIREAVTKVIEKDILPHFRPSKSSDLWQLFFEMCRQPGGLVSIEGVSQTLGISWMTTDNWLSSFETAMLLFRISNYSGARKQRKLYFHATAVPAIFSRQSLQTLAAGNLGWVWENIAATALQELTVLSPSKFLLRHLRYQTGRESSEIDFIVEEMPDRIPVAIEIGQSSTHSLKSLHKLILEFPQAARQRLSGDARCRSRLQPGCEKAAAV